MKELIIEINRYQELITISPKEKSGYRLFNLKTIEKIINKFEVWAVENKIEYK